MLPKAHRLAKSKDVAKVRLRGQSFFTPYFRITFLKSNGPSRLTVSVSTKISKKAVRRNTIKRIAREVLRGQLNKLPVGDYIVSARLPAAKLARPELRQACVDLLTKSRLI